MTATPSSGLISPDSVTWVVCLCAQWCGLCRDYRGVVAGMAALYPAIRFAWLDVEDQAELVGDVDVETFPTVLIADAQSVQFFGPLPPQPQNLSRLLGSVARSSLQARPHDALTRQVLGALQAAPEFWVSG